MLSYISLNLSQKSKKELESLVNRYISPDDYCYLARKGGNVTSKAHLTLFFGLIYERLDLKEINEILNKIKSEIKYLQVSKIQTWSFDKCNLLLAKIDKDEKLAKWNKVFLDFPHDKSKVKGFKPHISLAYMNKGIEIEFDYKLELEVEEAELKIFGPRKSK